MALRGVGQHQTTLALLGSTRSHAVESMTQRKIEVRMRECTGRHYFEILQKADLPVTVKHVLERVNEKWPSALGPFTQMVLGRRYICRNSNINIEETNFYVILRECDTEMGRGPCLCS